ncbi:MAG: IclR family transcriptional regulator [Polynucleobacter sp.]
MTNLQAAAADMDAKASMAEKVLLILEMVSHSEIPLTLENVSTGLRLAKPTAFRLLNTLNTLGFIERDFSGRRFQPGVRLRSIGTSMLFSDPIRAERIAAMKLLVDQIGETCNFNILDGNEVVYIDRIETNAPIRLHISAGMRVPLHCTASGKLFLSQMSPAQIERTLGSGPFEKFTSKTLLNLKELLPSLTKIKNQGYAIDQCEYLDGSICIAIPVLDSKNKMFAAIAAHGPSSRVSVKTVKTFIPHLEQAALSIRKSMSDTPSQPD